MLEVIVAGGSIAGLCAGIALRGIGCNVEIHERTLGAMTSRGAGIVAQPQLLRLVRDAGAPELPTTSCRYRRHLLPDDGDDVTRTERPLQFTSWYAIHRTLKSAFPADRYHSGSSLIGFDQTAGFVLAHFAEGGEIRADLLVCADGSRSEMRRRLAPEAEPSYAGYVAWRGTIEEKHAPAELVRFFDQSFTICEARSGGHILCYFIPGAAAATEDGARHLNWVWYVRVSDGPELEWLLTDKNGVLREASVSAGMVPTERVAEVHALAARELHPRFVELVQQTHDPFIQAIIDVTVPRMALGRVCLVGDAAFVLRPHPAAATAKAAADAMALAAALKSHPDEPAAALREWDARQFDYGSSLAKLATTVGKRSVEYPSASRDQADLAQRFRGISPVLPLE
jgi:2-polyprenyl-6-methoxyphenol hydroxylase-like FAD-dependent oxidoreductase